MMALKSAWDLERMHSKLFSSPRLKEENTLFTLNDQDKSAKGATDPVKEEGPSVSFQSKYIHIFPLYQEYSLREVKYDLNRLNKSLVSELITPEYLKGLQSPLSPHSRSGTQSPKQSIAETTVSPLPSHHIKVKPCTLWQELEEVKASGLLRSLTNRQIRLQECMFELIGSEASYLKSLGVAVNHFYGSKALKQTLSQREHHILFSNICRVMAASENFFMALEKRLSEHVLIPQVGDIVLKHCPEFQTLYVPYVTNMMFQEALLNQLLQQNRHFLYSLKKLESDPVCQRQSLKSFLVLPFQRITRVKLLLESILKLTEPDADSLSNLEKAIQAIYEIVMDCDKGVRKMKQTEELVCLKMLLDFGKVKSVPLVVSGRFLVHQGSMRQRTVENTSNSKVSFISIYLHLFNDLLIISLKKDQRFRVMDHAEFPTHVHVETLKTAVLGLPPDSFLLRLSQNQTGLKTAMILVAHTKSDKETWIKMLSCRH
ncbi:rho guanine nucleotide exchange factor 19 [Channa argus]|uniref:rho guanine nucleotide exchange factor 19 n=1 Tax=Channa argus TaxID=215402 RepID=UPI0035220DC8